MTARSSASRAASLRSSMAGCRAPVGTASPPARVRLFGLVGAVGSEAARPRQLAQENSGLLAQALGRPDTKANLHVGNSDGVVGRIERKAFRRSGLQLLSVCSMLTGWTIPPGASGGLVNG